PHDLTFAAGVSRGALRRILTTAACEVDGVREARVSVFGQRVKVRAAAEAHRIAEVTAEVHNAVERKIGELSLLKEPKIRVAVRCVNTCPGYYRRGAGPGARPRAGASCDLSAQPF